MASGMSAPLSSSVPPARRLHQQDYAALLALWAAAGLPAKPQGRDSQPDYERQLALPQIAYFGLFEGTELVAAVLATHDGRKGWVNRLAVLPRSRRRGYATHLIQMCEQWLVEQGIEIFACLIEDDNDPSRQAVLRAGYSLYQGVSYLTKRLRPEV